MQNESNLTLVHTIVARSLVESHANYFIILDPILVQGNVPHHAIFYCIFKTVPNLV